MFRPLFQKLSVIVGLLIVCVGNLFAQDSVQIDYLMDSDPPIPMPKSTVYFHPNLKSLLVTALQRPEADMQRKSAETIARTHELGLAGLEETIPQLERILETMESHPAARFAAARALIVLNSDGSADKLFAASQTHGADLRQLIEPALAKWNHPGAKAKWLERLTSKETTHRDLVLALRGLGAAKDVSVLEQLIAIVNNLTQEPDLRLEAASAAGQVADTGLEVAAGRLAADTRSAAFVNQICAIRLLARHSSPESNQLLGQLASHAEPVIASAALERLNAVDSNLVVPLAEAATKSKDPRVRLQGIVACLKLPTSDRIEIVGRLLTDPVPAIRSQVLNGLLKLSDDPVHIDAIAYAAARALQADKRQSEAAILAARLEDRSAASRLVELLNSEDRDVMIAAAWGLKILAVPETAPAILARAQQQTEVRRTKNVDGLDEQVAHLFEALGVMKTAEAEPLLRQYVPKEFYFGDLSRGAAIWALGKLKGGAKNEELAQELAERLRDFADQRPETARVKQMCCVAYVRINAVDQVDVLHELNARSRRPVSLSATTRWAISQLTGEEVKAPEPDAVSPGTWFLEPLP